MNTSGSPSKYLSSIGLLMMVLAIPLITSAECLKDHTGEVYCGAGRCLTDSDGIVWCSRYYNGHAERTSDGQVLCGKGQCMKQGDGLVFCSSEVGGAVTSDSRGQVRCYGQCEAATSEMCESTRADSSKK